MPEIDIGRDGMGRSQLVLKLLPGEKPKDFTMTNYLIARVMSYFGSYRKAQDETNAGDKLNRARELLASILPHAKASSLIEALSNNEIGTKAVIALKGDSEAEGFTVKSVKIRK